MASRRGKLTFSSDLPSAAASADLVIVAVGTHDGNGGWQTDTVRGALAELVPAMADGATLVVRSTLPPDFIRQLPNLVASRRAAAERAVRAGDAQPRVHPRGPRGPRLPGRPTGSCSASSPTPMDAVRPTLRELYRDAGAPIVVMGAIDAAITKLGANLFLATKISFANELAEICDAFGADVSTVVDGMSYDARIGGAFLKAGVGFGGSCLPNQVSMTIRTAAQAGVATPLLTAVDEVNHRRRLQVVERAAGLLEGSSPRPPRRAPGPDLQARHGRPARRSRPDHRRGLPRGRRVRGRLRPDADRTRALHDDRARSRGGRVGQRGDPRRRHRGARHRVAGVRRPRLERRRRLDAADASSSTAATCCPARSWPPRASPTRRSGEARCCPTRRTETLGAGLRLERVAPVDRPMTIPIRRHSLAIALHGRRRGRGIGHLTGEAGIARRPGPRLWVALAGVGGLIADLPVGPGRAPPTRVWPPTRPAGPSSDASSGARAVPRDR